MSLWRKINFNTLRVLNVRKMNSIMQHSTVPIHCWRHRIVHRWFYDYYIHLLESRLRARIYESHSSAIQSRVMLNSAVCKCKKIHYPEFAMTPCYTDFMNLSHGSDNIHTVAIAVAVVNALDLYSTVNALKANSPDLNQFNSNTLQPITNKTARNRNTISHASNIGQLQIELG